MVSEQFDSGRRMGGKGSLSREDRKRIAEELEILKNMVKQLLKTCREPLKKKKENNRGSSDLSMMSDSSPDSYLDTNPNPDLYLDLTPSSDLYPKINPKSNPDLNPILDLNIETGLAMDEQPTEGEHSSDEGKDESTEKKEENRREISSERDGGRIDGNMEITTSQLLISLPSLPSSSRSPMVHQFLSTTDGSSEEQLLALKQGETILEGSIVTP